SPRSPSPAPRSTRSILPPPATPTTSDDGIPRRHLAPLPPPAPRHRADAGLRRHLDRPAGRLGAALRPALPLGDDDPRLRGRFLRAAARPGDRHHDRALPRRLL